MGAWWFPENISEHGGDIDVLNMSIHTFMMILFVGWGTFFVYCLVRFRKRPGVPALTGGWRRLHEVRRDKNRWYAFVRDGAAPGTP